MESLARVAAGGGSAVEDYVKTIKEAVTCHVCHEIMCEPYVLSCGHSFCGVCLQHWFNTVKKKSSGLSCPVCRARVTTKPITSFALKEVYIALLGLLRSQDVLAAAEFEHDATTRRISEGDPFEGLKFTASASFVDTTDGVERCIYCHWELEDGVCPNCGAGDDMYTDDDFGSARDISESEGEQEEEEDDDGFIVHSEPQEPEDTQPSYYLFSSGSESSESESQESSEDELDILERRAEQQSRGRTMVIDEDEDDNDGEEDGEEDDAIEVISVRRRDEPQVMRVLQISDSE